MQNNSETKARQLYPLTHPQKRIWYIENIYPETSLYNIGGTVMIEGEVDLNSLEKAIKSFIETNESLHLKFTERDGKPWQFVEKFERRNIITKDFTSHNDPYKDFEDWVQEEAGKPFHLKGGELYKFEMYKLTKHKSGYLAKFHHSICDGWSIKVMTEQICKAYDTYVNGENNDIEQNYSYLTYLEQEEKYFSSERYLKNKTFWLEKFKDLTDIALNRSSDSIEGKRKTFHMDAELSRKIKIWAEENKVSLNTFFVTIYLIYLYKTTHQNDLVIGTPVLNRTGKKWKSIFGMFTSTMPFRFEIDEKSTALEMMNLVTKELKSCYFHQKYPYDLLVQELDLRKKTNSNLFNICVNYYNTRPNTSINGLAVENNEFYNGNQVYSLQMIIRDWAISGDLILDFDYKIEDYSVADIENMYGYLKNLSEGIISNSVDTIADMGLLSNEFVKKLTREFNNTSKIYPKSKPIYKLFEEQVQRTPDQIAVSCGNQGMTYSELNSKTNQLARKLREKGIGSGKIVGVLTEHSIETVIGILAVLKAGGAYLPINIDVPRERLSYMLDDSKAEMLMINSDRIEIPDFEGISINLNDSSLYSGNGSNIEAGVEPNELAYVIYTSGSTGKPKGVMIEHQGLVNYIWWAKGMYTTGQNEVIPLYSSLAFDLTVTSIFMPLISGNELRVYRDDGADYVLHKIIEENRATIIKLTPAHLSLMKDLNLSNSSIRTLIVGGEELKGDLANKIHHCFNGDIKIFNEYGPTETVVGCMIHQYKVSEDGISVPIGVPAANVQVYILDNDLNPVPQGTVGELYISGDGVARGYLNRAQLTEERFIMNPFIEGKRMYKSGDLAKFNSRNKIEYAGRVDHQVKIRGYRIELGEIEKYLVSNERIIDGAVLDFTTSAGDKYLCAFVVAEKDLKVNEVKEYLMESLPEYMIPQRFVIMERMPLTPNGKVDRDQLEEPVFEDVLDSVYVGGRNEKEKALEKAISYVLGLNCVSVKNNFYHLGGDSIKAIQVSSKVKDSGFKITVKDILSHPIIEEMALHLEVVEKMTFNKAPSEGSIKRTPIVSWFIDQNLKKSDHYHQSIVLEINQEIETKRFEKVLNELFRSHDSLRMNYSKKNENLVYTENHLSPANFVEEYDLSELSDIGKENEMNRIGEIFKSSFDITEGRLLKACIFNMGSNKKRIMLVAHHLIVDGVSWRILIEDINILLDQSLRNEKLELDITTHSYQEWAEKLELYAKEIVEEEEEYWKRMLDFNPDFPMEHDFGDDTVLNSETISLELNEADTSKLMTEANSIYKTEANDLLIASLIRTIKNHTGCRDVAIELEHHGREELFSDLDISRTIGWFTSMYPFAMRLESDEIGAEIKEIKERLREIPRNGIGFGILRYLSGRLPKTDSKYVRFNFLGEFEAQRDNEVLKLIDAQYGGDCSEMNKLTSLLDINCYIIEGKLKFNLTFSKNKFSEKGIEDFAHMLMENLKELVHHCCSKTGVEFTPSDFETIEFSQDDLDQLFA